MSTKHLFNWFRDTSDAALAEAMRKADEARDLPNPARAATLYQVILDRWGPTFGVMMQLGNALKDSGAYLAAEQSYRAALELEPLDADCHLQLGHLMKLADRPSAAERYYREAHRLGPDLPGPIVELQAIDERAAARAAEVRPAELVELAMQPHRIDVVDRSSRSLLIRQRLVGNLAWRRN